MTGGLLRVVVVDDDPDVRAALRGVLEHDPGCRLVAEAADGRQALQALRAHRVDVIVLDIKMPILDGLDTLRALRREHHPARVLVLTTYGDVENVREAIALGADGFLLKTGDPRELLRAIRSTNADEAWLSPNVAHLVAEELRHGMVGHLRATQAAERLSALTPRERDVARLVAQGSTNADIAQALGLSESTIKAYVSSAIDRLDLRNRVELAALLWESREGWP